MERNIHDGCKFNLRYKCIINLQYHFAINNLILRNVGYLKHLKSIKFNITISVLYYESFLNS